MSNKIIEKTIGLLDIIYPGSCSLCGNISSDRMEDALCDRCRISLTPIYPGGCIKCGVSLISENIVCRSCRETESFYNTGFSLFFYRGVARELMYQYKFNNCRELSNYWIKKLYCKMNDRLGILPIIPVPVLRKSLKRRGWDPVGLIVSGLHLKYQIPVFYGIKRLKSKTQKSLDRLTRENNLKGKILLTGIKLPPKVYLIDDVWTTGATINECSKVLKSGGVREVHVLTLCRD